MKTLVTHISLAILLVVAAGCKARLKCDLETMGIGTVDPENESKITWYDMTRDSKLYKDPLPARFLNSQQARDYVRGFRLGWENAGDDHIVGLCPGACQLYFLYVPATRIVRGEISESFRKGEEAGTRQARLDFNTFCLELENRLAEQKPLTPRN